MFLQLAFNLSFCFYQCIHPNADARLRPIAFRRNDRNRRFLNFFDVGVANVFVHSDEHTPLQMAVPNDSWVFYAVFRSFSVKSEDVGKAFNIKARFDELLRVDCCAKGILKKQDTLVTLLYVAQGASTHR